MGVVLQPKKLDSTPKSFPVTTVTINPTTKVTCVVIEENTPEKNLLFVQHVPKPLRQEVISRNILEYTPVKGHFSVLNVDTHLKLKGISKNI